MRQYDFGNYNIEDMYRDIQLLETTMEMMYNDIEHIKQILHIDEENNPEAESEE